MKTLLRYPGGKSRAVKKIVEYFPSDLKEMCSPFFGGGAIELEMASKGVIVSGFDTFKLLVNFWNHALANKESNANKEFIFRVTSMYQEGVSKEEFKTYQEHLSNYVKEDCYSASVFYMLNRCSFSGTTLSGGMSPKTPRFTESSIQRLKDFECKTLTVEYGHFDDTIEYYTNVRNVFKYCDPPYLIESKLYGIKGDTHKNFDHEWLASSLKKSNNWILSYNDCEWVRETYKDYKIVELNFPYGMSKSKTELLIINT